MKVVVVSAIDRNGAKSGGASVMSAHVQALKEVAEVVELSPDSSGKPGARFGWNGSTFCRRTTRGILAYGESGLAEILERPDAASALALADVVEVHFVSGLRLIRRIRRLTSARLVYFAHDVFTTVIWRRTCHPASRREAITMAAALPAIAISEFLSLRKADVIRTMGHADAVRLQKIPGLKGKVRPYIPMADHLLQHEGSVAPKDARPTILFVGPTIRAENRYGLHWFIDNVWTDIKRLHPDAVIRIVGETEPDGRRPGEGVPGVVYVGEIADLKREYETAAVIIAPIFHGAGVKIKVLEAMAFRRPVIGTATAVEGVAFGLVERWAPVVTWAVKTPEGWCAALDILLSDPSARREHGSRNRMALEALASTADAKALLP